MPPLKPHASLMKAETAGPAPARPAPARPLLHSALHPATTRHDFQAGLAQRRAHGRRGLGLPRIDDQAYRLRAAGASGGGTLCTALQ